MLSLLEKLPPGRALEFSHRVVDGMCGRAYPRYQEYGSVWSLAEWMELLEEMRMYFKTAVGKNMSDEEAAQQINELDSHCQEAITKCLKGRKEEIRNALVERVNAISSAQLQDFDWQLKSQIIYGVSSFVIQRAMPTIDKILEEQIQHHNVLQMNQGLIFLTALLLTKIETDMNSWLALSSDKISMLQMPLLNLDLDVRENGEIKPVSIEMNKEELQNLINALEAANKVVLQLK